VQTPAGVVYMPVVVPLTPPSPASPHVASPVATVYHQGQYPHQPQSQQHSPQQWQYQHQQHQFYGQPHQQQPVYGHQQQQQLHSRTTAADHRPHQPPRRTQSK
jgi:hypothetical protein